MKILIIIYVYNSQDYIIRLLESIKNQTYKKYIVYIINDNSLDDSLILINKFINNKENINFNLVNYLFTVGKYVSVNKILKKIKSDLFIVLDSNLEFAYNKLEIDYKIFIQNRNLFCLQNKIVPVSNDNISRKYKLTIETYNYEIIKKIGLFNEYYLGSDIEYYARLKKYIGKKYINKSNDSICKLYLNYKNYEFNIYNHKNYLLFYKQMNFIHRNNLNFLFDNLNEKIHIILCCWKRIENLEKQIINLNDQTVGEKIILHLINNNVDNKDHIKNIINKLSSNLKLKIILSHYDNKYSCFQRFFYIKEKIMYNYYCSHIIIIDDDQLFYNDWVEKMYKLKKPNTIFSWYVKKWKKTNLDYWNGSIIKFSKNILDDKIYLEEEFDYGGPGGSIIDISIFNKKSKLWDIPINKKFNVYQIDDLWLSFIAKYFYNWSIKFSGLYEKESLNYNGSNSQKNSLYLTLKNDKQSLFEYIINNFDYIK